MSEEPTTKPAPTAPVKPRNKWRRRLKVMLFVLMALVIGFRTILYLVLPTVIQKVARSYGLECTYERMQLSLTGGDVGIWRMKLTPKAGGNPIIQTGYIRGNISVYELFKGRLEVWRAEVDGASMVIDRGADGRIRNLQELIDSLPISRSVAATLPTAPTTQLAQKPIDLEPPLRIEALRLSRMRLHIIDHSVTPNVNATVDLNVRVSDLGSPTNPVRFEVLVWSDELVDTLNLEGEARTAKDKLELTARLVVSGLHGQPALGYIKPFGLKPIAYALALRANAAITVRVLPDGRFAGSVRLDDVSAMADNLETFGADKVSVEVESLDALKAVVPSLVLENPRISARLTPELNLQVAGLELDTQVQQPQSSQSLPRIEIGQFKAMGGTVEFIDGRIPQAPKLRALIKQASSTNIVIDQNSPDQPLALTGEFELPGLARQASLDVTCRPLASRKTFGLTLHAAGVRPDIAAPYLDMAGIQSELKDATFDCSARGSVTLKDDGSVVIDARASDVVLSDAGELLNLKDAAIRGLKIDPKQNAVRVESVEIIGPSIAVRHDPTGAIAAMGLRVPIPLRIPGGSTTKPSQSPANLPRVEIGRLAWKSIRVTAEDRAVSPPTTLTIADAGLELSDLVWSPDPAARPAPGSFRAHVSAPGLARSFQVQGRLTPGADAISMELDASGQGLSPVAIASYLKPLNVQPLIRDGEFTAQVKTTLKRVKGAIAGDLALRNLRLTDGGNELARVDLLSVATDGVTAGKIDLSEVTLAGGSTGITREADGRFVVAGVRLPPIGGGSSRPGAELPAISVKKLHVADSSLGWTDLAVTPQVRTQATASLEMADLSLGKTPGPATLKLSAKVKDVIDSATVSGQIVPSSVAPSAALDIQVDGIRAGALSPYIPPQVEVSLRSGRVRTHLEAGISPHPQGGYAARLDLADLDYRDGDALLVALKKLRVNADRLDPAENIISLDEFSVMGLDTDARRAADGALAAAGLRLLQAPTAPTTRPAVPATQMALDPALIAAQARAVLPLIAVKTLSLDIKRLGLVDQANAALPPVTLRDFQLTNQNPIEWMGKRANTNPPTQFKMRGKIDPVAESFSLNLTAAPFVSQPVLNAELTAGGIKGAGIQAFAPQLAERIDFSGLKDGQLKLMLESQLKLDRRVANDFDLTRGFDLNLHVRDLEFRPEAGAPPVAALKELRTENARINLGAGIIHLRNLEITNPSALAIRKPDGLHAMGVVVRLPELATTRPATTQPAAAIAKAEPTTRPAGEIRVDRLLVSGVDVRLEDRVLEPAVVVPLNSLDLEVRELSTTARYEDKPIRFNVIASAGKVTVPGKSGQAEERDLFAQALASGNLSLYPRPSGWVKSSITGFELAAISGIAKSYGVNLSGGTFDTTSELRLQSDGSGEARARAVLNELRLSEPANGPISRGLKLPGGLDVAIAAVQDADGSITLPVKVPIRDGNIEGIPSAAVGAAAHVMISALAAAPAKTVQSVGAMVGLKLNKKLQPPPPVALSFLPGHTALEPESRKALDELIGHLRKSDMFEVTIRHELGQTDLPRARELSNPTRAEALAVASQLRMKKVQLLESRSRLAGESRARLAALGAADASASIEQLRAIDRELAQTEDALDRLYDLTRPGADRQADRRTRTAAIEIGKLRLETVRTILLNSGIRNIDARLRVTNAIFNPGEEEQAKVTITTAVTNVKKQ